MNKTQLVFAISFLPYNEGKKVEDAYRQKCLVILDDPISSFDFETKIGMLSLISWQEKEILLRNCQSRIVLMTHDIEIFKHFNTILRDTEELRKKLDKENNRLCLGKKGKVPETKICFSQQYLKNGKLVTIDKKSNTKNEYRNQLATVYKYAKDPNTEQDGIIGNCMRRVLEGFASFSYCSSSRSIFIDPDILEELGDTKIAKFYTTFMSRLILNGESHFEDRVQGLTDSDWEKFIDHDELVKTAKLVIFFLYKVNKIHVMKNLSHLKEVDTNTIESWRELIP